MIDYVGMISGMPDSDLLAAAIGPLVMIPEGPSPLPAPNASEQTRDENGLLLTPKYDPNALANQFPSSPTNSPPSRVRNPGTNNPYVEGGLYTYSGSDIQVMVEEPRSGRRRELKQVQTLSVSVHRAHAPVLACGYVGIKGLAPGRRTVAGTIVFTQFVQDVFFELLDALYTEKTRDSTYSKIDQLKPLNLTILLANEYGYVSYRRLLGVKFLTDGTVYSVHDPYSENTVSYMAADFTPLLQSDADPFSGRVIQNKLDDAQGRTFRDLMKEQELLQAARNPFL